MREKGIAVSRCSRCGCEAEADWVMIPDSHWSSFFVGCANDLCDSMLSAEIDFSHKNRERVEDAVRSAWNLVHQK
jgi:hypothetical protein